MIDTHCHLDFKHFKKELNQILERAEQAGITHIFMPAMNFDSVPQLLKIKHPDIQLYAMAGIHPTEINEGISTTEEELLNFGRRDEIIAIGETGLDYYWSDDFKKQQKKNLHIHCKVARQVEKPVILHNRESTADLLDIIEHQQDGKLKGIWHCFNGTVDEGKRMIDLGFLLGIGGVLTFKNSGVDELVAQLPLDKMVLETDAPYLTPEPHRGERNEPAYTRYVAQKLAKVQDVSLEEVISITDQNALNLFGVK